MAKAIVFVRDLPPQKNLNSNKASTFIIVGLSVVIVVLLFRVKLETKRDCFQHCRWGKLHLRLEIEFAKSTT